MGHLEERDNNKSKQGCSLVRKSSLPNLEAVLWDAAGVALEVEEPGERVEDPQRGGDDRVLQASDQDRDEEHRHHLKRVLVPPLHSTTQIDKDLTHFCSQTTHRQEISTQERAHEKKEISTQERGQKKRTENLAGAPGRS